MTPESPDPGPNPWHEIDDVYHTVLEWFYEKEDRLRAAPHALHLLRLLDEHDPTSETLLGRSGRCVIAELDRDTAATIHYRLLEIDAVKSLHRDGVLERIGMGPDDVSDRLDLLACDYLAAQRYDAALAALAESEAFCKQHGTPFDGNDIRADVKRAMRRKRPVTAKTV